MILPVKALYPQTPFSPSQFCFYNCPIAQSQSNETTCQELNRLVPVCFSAQEHPSSCSCPGHNPVHPLRSHSDLASSMRGTTKKFFPSPTGYSELREHRPPHLTRTEENWSIPSQPAANRRAWASPGLGGTCRECSIQGFLLMF